MDVAPLIREVEDFYLGYIEAFNEADVETYCNCFDEKSVMLKRDVFSVLPGGPGLVQHAQALRQRLAGSDWARTDIVRQHVWPIEPGMACIVADLSRMSESGAEYERARCMYLVVRRDTGWKIRSSTVSTQALPQSDGLLGH